jgi:hypothetical protein
MGRDLVQQQHGRRPLGAGLQACMGEHDRDQQRLLFAGRAIGGGGPLGGVMNLEIGAVRADRSAADLGIEPAVRPEFGA